MTTPTNLPIFLGYVPETDRGASDSSERIGRLLVVIAVCLGVAVLLDDWLEGTEPIPLALWSGPVIE